MQKRTVIAHVSACEVYPTEIPTKETCLLLLEDMLNHFVVFVAKYSFSENAAQRHDRHVSAQANQHAVVELVFFAAEHRAVDPLNNGAEPGGEREGGAVAAAGLPPAGARRPRGGGAGAAPRAVYRSRRCTVCRGGAHAARASALMLKTYVWTEVFCCTT